MTEDFTIRTVDKIREIPSSLWNGLRPDDHPFVSHEFLSALEESGSATSETGWLPMHLVLEQNGNILGVAPMYLKGHSQGEYVFDHSWADAYERAGGRYYPKLQLAVPFSPVTGPRFLCGHGPAEELLHRKTLLAQGAKQVAVKYGLSSVHATFLQKEDTKAFTDQDYLLRVGEQFHWFNDGYDTFDAFLNALSSRKRKAIRKERKPENFADLTFETLTDKEITSTHWDAFFEFYMDTGSRKWGIPYLNREFFDILGATLGPQIVLMMVKREGRYIAGALNLVSQDCLYGRYWGCIEDHRFLHFETCYYRAIEYAIEQKLDRVEAGAQGPHKLARGYLPTKTYSAHWMQDPGFHDAISDFLQRETRHMDAELAYLGKLSPFKKS
ncbi:GNAT family N-acetyltransferase [Sneathiella limimaris]|uniref:GNAT family N-acetyltransferase n=1 Tax=Sneathiella limimaris TaxID=1964213 RepID=UPI00146CEB9F|nr:GNAT family N-acetyltransferase [Sneathiella limimaris]